MVSTFEKRYSREGDDGDELNRVCLSENLDGTYVRRPEDPTYEKRAGIAGDLGMDEKRIRSRGT